MTSQQQPRQQRTLSLTSTHSPCAPVPVPPSTPQRSRTLTSRKSSHANLKGFIKRLRSKNSLDFGCSGSIHARGDDNSDDEELFGTATETFPPSSGTSASGSTGASPAQSRRQSRQDGPTSSFEPLYSPPLCSVPASPTFGPQSRRLSRDEERLKEEKAAEEALLDYMSRASLSARKASLPTSSLMSPVPLESNSAAARARCSSTSTMSSALSSVRSSRPRTGDSLGSSHRSSVQSHPSSPATSLASSCGSGPHALTSHGSFRRPKLTEPRPNAMPSADATAGPRSYSFI